MNIVETFFEPDALLLNLMSDASNFLVIFNSSVNYVIYMTFNKAYREQFMYRLISIIIYYYIRPLNYFNLLRHI